MCCIKGCLGLSKYFQTKAVFKVLYCLERVFWRTWELAFPVRRFFRSQRSVEISWNSEIWNNTNLSTQAHVPTPRYGQYLRHAHNPVHECHYQGDMVVRMLKVLAILGSWYVRSSVLKLDLKYLETFWRLILICIFDAWRSKITSFDG